MRHLQFPLLAAMVTASMVLGGMPGATAVVPLPTEEPVVVTGSGFASFDNFYLGLHCDDRAYDIQFVVVDGTAHMTIQAVQQDPWDMCNTHSIYYSVNPSIVTGDWQDGWVGEAVGVGVIWPLWDVVVSPTEDPDVWHMWSFYIDENGRDYLLEGDFTIDHRI